MKTCPACNYLCETPAIFIYHMAMMHPGHAEAPAYMCMSCHAGWPATGRPEAMAHGRTGHEPKRSIIVSYGVEDDALSNPGDPVVLVVADPKPGDSLEQAAVGSPTWARRIFDESHAQAMRAIAVMPIGLYRTQAIASMEQARLFFEEGMRSQTGTHPALCAAPPAPSAYLVPDAAPKGA